MRTGQMAFSILALIFVRENKLRRLRLQYEGLGSNLSIQVRQEKEVNSLMLKSEDLLRR
jgi:hypothetical protein